MAVPLAGTILLWDQRIALAAIAAIPVLIFAFRRPGVLAPLLLTAAAPLARPNVAGEQYSYVAAGLVFAAAAVSLIADRGRVAILGREARPLRSVAFWLALGYAWLAVTATDDAFRPVMQSVVLTVGVVAAVGMVLADRKRAVVTAKLFIALLLALTVSWVVTAGLWATVGVGSGRLFEFTLAKSFPQTVYAPFTITTGTTGFSGFEFPRFSGIGREPGWMAMYLACAFFILPRLGWTKARWRLLCVLGLAGTTSTAGFGVFVMVLAFELFLRSRPASSLLADYCRRVTGLVVLGGAAWLAIYAPVFGLEAKGTINQVSVAERGVETSAGWTALLNDPFGGATYSAGGTNLIASVAAAGLPFVLCVIAALLAPRLSHKARSLTSAPIMVLLLTLLTSQPPEDSTWVFVAAVMVYAVLMPAGLTVDGEPVSASLPSPAVKSPHRRRPVAMARPPV